LGDLPVGYAISTVFAAVFVLLGLRPRPTRGPRVTPSFVLATVSSELHVLMLLLVGAPTVLAAAEGDLDSRFGAAILALAALAVVGIVVSVVRAARTVGVLESALRAELGADVRLRRGTEPREFLRVLLAPLIWRRRDVVRVKDVRYGPASGKANLLDVYRRRARSRPGPVLLHLHGGGFFSGVKSREARLLLERFASRGWVCVSANYRLRPAEFPAQVIDAKRVIAWLRTEGKDHGADPSDVLVVGGSAGGHIAMFCALTGNDARFQPGFEHVDTRIAGAVSLYGYYGPASDGTRPSSPTDYLRRDAAPIMLVHGVQDPMVPMTQARTFATKLRARSRSPVVWAELPGGLHTFDRFASIRSAGVAAGVEAFADRLVSNKADPFSPPAPGSS
jgi:acetyl esterase/lipase